MSALEPTKLPKSEKLRGATIFDDETNEEIGPTCFREHLDEAFDCLVVTFKYDAHVASLIYDAIHNAVHQGNFSEEDYMQLQIRFKSVYINAENQLADDDETVEAFRQKLKILRDAIISIFDSEGIKNTQVAFRIYCALFYLVGKTAIHM